MFLRLITNLSDADATLNAECGEECCDHAYDKLEYSLERFFVFCVTHGIRSLKLLTWLFSPATFGAPPRCLRLLPAFFVSDSKDTTSPKINHTFLYVSCDSRTFSFKFFYFAHGLHGNFYPRSTRNFFIHGSHGSHGFFTTRFLNTNRTN